jgi:ABC-2 type transport system ATP-binding protein
LTTSIYEGATGLVGRNGAGKSTLLKLLLGLVKADGGDGRVLGEPLCGGGRRLRRAVGYFPEGDAFLPGMKAVEQVRLAGELCSLAARESMRRAHEVLSYVGLGEARYRTVEQFSTGMKQRLKLAAALVHDPELLLLDEPTVGLDPPGRQRMLELIRDLVDRHGKSVLLSTHLLTDIQHTCSDVVMIDGGELLAAGALDSVLGRDATRLRLQWDGDGRRFVELLREEGGAVEQRDRLSARPGSPWADGEAFAQMPESFDLRRMFELAHEGGVRLRTLDAEYEELTDLYHRLLDRRTGAG